MSSARSRTPEPPYCWQSKEALRRVRDYMQARDQWPKVSSRLSFYLALSEMASNLNSQSFRAPQKALADLSGISARTQTEIIRDLQRARVIAVTNPENGGQGQKTYTLLSVASEATSERTEATSERTEASSKRSEMSEIKPQLPTLDITREEQEKEHREGSLNGSEDRNRSCGEERVHQLTDALPDSQSSSGPLAQIHSARLKPLAQDVLEAWNNAPKLPRIRNLNEKRKRALSARTKDAFFVEHFREAIARMSQSKFCLGDNDNGWRASFDWFLKPDTVTKIIEGNYDAAYQVERNSGTPEPELEQLNRAAIDHDAFHSFLGREHPAGIKQGWTPATAPEGVI